METQIFTEARRLDLARRSLTAREHAVVIVEQSQETRDRNLSLRRDAAQWKRARLVCRIQRGLHRGWLPYASTAVVCGAPGEGGVCDACGAVLLGSQVVMTVPSDKAFVLFHADCFMLWDTERRTNRRALSG
jgi:hypothetical protein